MTATQQPIPPAALEDPDAVELARIWIAAKGLHSSLRIGIYEKQGIAETKAWGVILADMIRHLSDALSEGDSRKADIKAQEIMSHLVEELDWPTSSRSGGYVRQQ